jgi:diguanylate cyclase (GGDEF)-like protein
VITRTQFSLRGASLSSASWYFSVALGWPLIAYAAWRVFTAPGIGHAPAFMTVAALAVVLELLPVVQGRGHDPQGVVMSTAFSMAMLVVWGVWPAVVIIALASTISDLRAHKAWWKTAFNPAQYALSLASAYPIAPLTGHAVSLAHPLSSIQTRDLLWMVVAWVVYFTVNLLVVSAVLSWAEPFREILFDDVWHDVAMNFAVLAISPLVAALTMHAWGLIPLLLAPMMLIYYTAETSLQREHAAGHDSLTGLPNRTTLRYEVDEALATHARFGLPFGLMLIDLDDFKTVNDTLGHQVGDALLTEIAARLRASVREGDLVARLGGDEFAVLVPDADLDEVRAVAERLREGVGSTVALENMQLEVRMSVGIATCPEDGTDGAALLRHADVAMYRAKNARTGIEVYAAEHDDNSMARLALLSDLRQALQTQDELELYYQPKQTPEGRPLGMEALLRWRHPMYGLILPDEFVPLAERSGVMPALSARVIALAVAQLAQWRELGLEVQVAVNVAPTDFAGEQLPLVIEQELTAWGVPPEQLCLEITERVMSLPDEHSAQALEQLRTMGVLVSLDDFGTGYSSLLRLNSIPVDEIKIDRAFVARLTENPQGAGIVRTMIALAHGIGVPAVAEGVETQFQLDMLRTMQCDGVQGWHIARPMPAPAATQWLQDRVPSLRTSRIAG